MDKYQVKYSGSDLILLDRFIGPYESRLKQNQLIKKKVINDAKIKTPQMSEQIREEYDKNSKQQTSEQINPMRQQKPYTNYNQQQQPDQEINYGGYLNSSAQVQRLKKVILGLIVFIVILSGLFIYRELHNVLLVKSGKFYENQVLGYEMDEFWKMTAKQMEEQQAETDKKILDSSSHAISRQQLGRNSWTLLHMVTGAFPQEINDTLIKKFNAFLILFGQMYPCKLCANHFMELLKEVGQFKGTTKLELMTYLCGIHNKVNKKLGKPEHSCANIVEEWNTCGCSVGR